MRAAPSSLLARKTKAIFRVERSRSASSKRDGLPSKPTLGKRRRALLQDLDHSIDANLLDCPRDNTVTWAESTKDATSRKV